MQLFSFGHPCEHQLRRTCIGGFSCPLNGYPDNWCCSFIKGKINFKRDKPCEGPRCRWGFTHPSQSQFDAVTHVLNESRPIAAKLDEADEKDLLSFGIDNPHIVDTVQCALHMMRHPPSSCTRRVGQLLAYAALKAGEPKVFMQLLKTMKKPVDGYLLGAHDYLTNGVLPAPSAAPAHGKTSGKKGTNNEKKEDISDELKNDMVDLMNAALSSGGQLVNREDQHILQAVFIQVLRTYPKSNKKRQEMLDLAVAKFGTLPIPKNPGGVGGQNITNNSNSNNSGNNTNNSSNNTLRQGGTPASSMTAAAAAAAAVTSTITPGKSATSPTTTNTNTATTAAANPSSTTAASTGNATVAGGQIVKRVETLDEEGVANASHANNHTHHNSNNNSNATSSRRPQAIGGSAATSSAGTRQKDSGSSSFAKAATAAPQPSKQLQQPQPQQQQQTIVGISRVAQQVKQAPPRHYDPVRTDLPLPNILLFGGLFGLTPQSTVWALLGRATCHKPPSAATNISLVSGSAESPTDVVTDVDDKMFRFLASSASGYNFFSGIEVLSTEQQVLKGICED